jgi:hypothetical protein
LVPGKRLAVFSIRKMERGDGSVWVRAGSAFVNKDGSMNVLLDVLPLDGKLHVREAGEKRDSAGGAARYSEGAPSGRYAELGTETRFSEGAGPASFGTVPTSSPRYPEAGLDAQGGIGVPS